MNPDFTSVWAWLARDGVVVFGGKLREELLANHAVAKELNNLRRRGAARLVDDSAIREAESNIHMATMRSDDPHVIALALASGARVLCTEENSLVDDFRDKKLINNPRGKVYKRNDHKHLLTHTPTCGASRIRRTK